MKKRISIMLTLSLFLCMMIGTQIFATAVNEYEISLGFNQVWNTRPGVTRSRSYSTVYARCKAVYPAYGSDNFSKIRVKVKNSNDADITDVYVLTEGSGNSELKIKEGYLTAKTIKFAFSGNNPDYSALANVYYDPR